MNSCPFCHYQIDFMKSSDRYAAQDCPNHKLRVIIYPNVFEDIPTVHCVSIQFYYKDYYFCVEWFFDGDDKWFSISKGQDGVYLNDVIIELKHHPANITPENVLDKLPTYLMML